MTSAFRVTSGYLEGRLLLLPADRTITVGTSLERDLILFGRDINKTHCKISPVEDGQHCVEAIRDSVVRFGKATPHRLVLKDGDAIAIGDHGFVYHESLEDTEAGPRCLICDQELDSQGALGSACERCLDRRLVAARSLDNYKILRKIQMTDLDVTYMAVETRSKRKVSLRLFKAEHLNNKRLVRRYLSRAMVGMTIVHPCFARIDSIGTAHGSCFLVRELVEDSYKLERFLREQTPLEAPQALYLLGQFLEIAAIARERKILVARRKPSGIYVIKNNRLKVSSYDLTSELEEAITATSAYQDFLAEKFRSSGDAPLADEHEKLDRIEREPKSLRTMPPEPVDILMLGRIFYHLLSGEPFDPSSATQTIIAGYGKSAPRAAAAAPETSDTDGAAGEAKVETKAALQVTDRKGPLAGCPREVLMTLARMVTADPGKRFRSLEEVRATVERLRGED